MNDSVIYDGHNAIYMLTQRADLGDGRWAVISYDSAANSSYICFDCMELDAASPGCAKTVTRSVDCGEGVLLDFGSSPVEGRPAGLNGVEVIGRRASISDVLRALLFVAAGSPCGAG